MTGKSAVAVKEFLAGYLVLYEEEIYPEIEDFIGATKLKWYGRTLGKHLITSKTRGGNYRLDVVGSNPVFQSFDDVKYYFMENSYFSRLYNELVEADVFCDVGGYHGFYSLVSSSEKSIVFEADPSNAEHIRQNIELNPNRDIELVEKAVWSGNETLNFEAEASGTSHVSEKGIQRGAVTLDSFFEDREDPDVIKIDIEGAEGHLLEGAENLLERSYPTLFIEFHFDGRMQIYGHSFEGLKNFLENRGYDFSFVENRKDEKLVIAE